MKTIGLTRSENLVEDMQLFVGTTQLLILASKRIMHNSISLDFDSMLNPAELLDVVQAES